MYRTVIVPLDASKQAEAAVPVAVELAAAEDAALILYADSSLDITHTYLTKMALTLPVPTAVETATNEGHAERSAADAIADLVRSGPDSLLCMTTHGRGGVGRALLGSTAERILQLVSEPVLLVGPHCRSTHVPGGNVVVPLDGSELSEQVLPTARAFVKSFDLQPWLVSVIDPRVVPGLGDDVLETSFLARVAHEWGADDGEVEWDALHGHDPAEAIVGFAERLPASLIAMTTHGRTGLSRLTVGSVAMQVVHDAPCPVLVQRPS